MTQKTIWNALRAALCGVGVLFVLGACSAFQTATVPTVKAQQLVDFAQSAYKVDLRAENIYLSQPACGLPKSPAPPLCASYAVGVRWKELDNKLKTAIADVQAKLNVLGTDPKVIDAAVAAMQLALTELENFTSTHEVKK